MFVVEQQTFRMADSGTVRAMLPAAAWIVLLAPRLTGPE